MDNQKRSNPFKDISEFEKDLTAFANSHRIVIAEHARRISDYFEMSCYSMIVKYYELNGYTVYADNLFSGQFKFKCSPKGLLKKFSYFKAKKDDQTFRIYHNASVQSKYEKRLFTTPDIVIATDEEPEIITDYYLTKMRFSYIPNKQMISFCEAKHYIPFPELIINFIGTVHELFPSCLKNHKTKEESLKQHIAPSLMMSGYFSKQAKAIKESFEKRYTINVIGDLVVNPYMTVFCSSGIPTITTLGYKGEGKE